jgi:hypothetical protein
MGSRQLPGAALVALFTLANMGPEAIQSYIYSAAQKFHGNNKLKIHKAKELNAPKKIRNLLIFLQI